MKIVGLEEHFVTQDVLAAWHALDAPWRDPGLQHHEHGDIGARLIDLAECRVADMDAMGMDLQVLSLTAPGLQSQKPEQAVRLQRSINDLIANTIRQRADRFQGFATLATPDPDAAAAELRRAVTQLGLNGAMLFGRTRDRNLDHRDNWPIFETAAALRAPLYIHPQSPVPAVRDALYSGNGDDVDAAFATFGLGWHYETGVQILRMILAGVFDRFPDLVEFLPMGDGFTWDTQDRAQDIASTRRAWDEVKRMIADPSYAMVVADELNIVLRYDYLPLSDVLEALAAKPAMTHVVITGRNAPEGLIAVADLVTEMGLVKHPFREQGVKAQAGVEF